MPRDFLDVVYRHIALGRYQEAIHILNRQIKKQPDNLVLKVWKCEALFGLGNVAESEDLMSSICEEHPTDKQTIDCLADYYRARGNYARLVEVYEEALKNCASDESWRKSIFECSGLAGDYKKQHQQALILYKQTHQMLYYFMAVVCLLQQGRENKLSLELAGRMMVKQYESGMIKSKNEILLMIIVLERQSKFEEALLYLEKHSSTLDTMISTIDKKFELLEKLKRWHDLIVLLKENIVKKPDNWTYWKIYLEAISSIQEEGGCADDPAVDDSVDKAREFINKISLQHHNLRGPHLALIELIKRRKDNLLSNDLCKLFLGYFDRFGDKTICAFDLSLFISEVPKDAVEGLLSELSGPNHSNTTSISLQSKLGASKHITFLQISRRFGQHSVISSEQRKLLCNDLEMCYKAAGNNDRREQYLQLLAPEFIRLYKETGDAEYLIRTACLLEDALSESAVFALQVLLLRVYFALGASKAARKIYELLRIQSVQVDTLAHIFLSTLSSTGHFTLASEMWDSALKILKQCATESLEALVLCYRAGLFHRIEELTECARRFQHTISVPLLQGEKNFLDLVMGEPSRSEQNILKTRSSVSWETCLDNRDLKPLPSWDPPSSQTSAVHSFEELILLCKIREATLACLSSAVAFGKQRKEMEEKNFHSALDKLQMLYTHALSLSNRDTAETRLFQIVQNPLPSILEKLLEPDLSSTDKVCTMLVKGVDSCSTLANSSNTRCLMEAVVTQIELLSVATVACGAARAGLAPGPRRRSDQIIRSLETAWSNVESCLPPSQKFNNSSPSNNTRFLVESKIRENIQAASEELRRVVRKKITYLHKLIAN